MLRELAVRNLALIEDVRVDLPTGFCAWTGETGAGKSLLLGAVGLLLGERGSVEFLRAGADELSVVGRFEVAGPLRDAVTGILGREPDDDAVILTRRIRRDGKGAAYCNGEPVALATLKALGSVLLDIHGQRESHSLLQPSYQLQLLDSYGRLDKLRGDYEAAADKVRGLRRQYAELTGAAQQRARELSLLRFEQAELEQAELKPGELTELQQGRERLVHAQALQEFTAGGAALLYDDEGSVVERLGKLAREAERWREVDPRLTAVADRLQTLIPDAEDVADTLRDLGQAFDADPASLEDTERRLGLLRKLESKYRQPIDELVLYRDTLADRVAGLEKQDADSSAVEEQLTAAHATLRAAAKKLSDQRAKVARKLAAEGQKHLAELGMPDARLDAALTQTPLGDDPRTADVPAAGVDHLEFVLAANPGEPARPLRKVASGGELSRTLLALKTVLAHHDPVGTLIFDEIDANIGGRLGDVVGRKLAALGATHQVVCVTHLPQVASYASVQWTIRKQTSKKRTTTTITPLDAAGRVEELASMLRGEARGETTRQEVAAMLAAAAKARR